MPRANVMRLSLASMFMPWRKGLLLPVGVVVFFLPAFFDQDFPLEPGVEAFTG